LCNSFLTSKKNKLESDELSPQSFANYFASCTRLIKHFGPDRRVDDLRPNDFEIFRKLMAKHFSSVTLKNEINRIRIILKFAFDQRLITERVSYGQSFNKPSLMMLRKARNEAGPKDFSSEELRKILAAADPIMRAMILLGINAGFGNTDCANLPRSAINFETGWLNFPRVKTAIERRIPMWPETLAALKVAIERRPNPKDRADSDLCFITAKKNRWVRVQPSKSNPDKLLCVNSISNRFAQLLKSLSINGRKRTGFYGLRHSFETAAGESKDQIAVNALMGHVDNSMAGVYRERISDARLRAVVDVVHDWLFDFASPK
jgi:integrase